MKTLYLECNMGAAGDMLMAALLELLPGEEKGIFLDKMNHLVEGAAVSAEPAIKCGITGTHMSVVINGEEEESHDHNHDHHHDHEHGDHDHDHHHDHEHGDHDHDHHHEHEHPHDHAYSHDEEEHDHDHRHEYNHNHEHNHDHDHNHDHNHDYDHDHHSHAHSHHHAGMKDIEDLVEKMDIPETVKTDVMAVYRLIAEAESHAHGKPVDEIHFHEVGSKDAVIDITGVCLLINMLAPDRIAASAVHVGSGHVHCAHGILPVPAPATAYILQGVPSYSADIRGELCTPTGAALLKHFAEKFGSQPLMAVEKTGYGMGKKDFEKANCVRAMIGTEMTESTKQDELTDEIAELVCNLDDMTGEEIGFAQEMLWEQGALDVFTTPIFMKKNRPAVMLTVLCRESEKQAVIECLFRCTTTIGIRERICRRYILKRTLEKKESRFGSVRVKKTSGYGCEKEKLEFEDLAEIARRENKSLAQIRQEL